MHRNFSLLTYIVVGKRMTQTYRRMITLRSCTYMHELLLISANDNELDVLLKKTQTKHELVHAL